MARISYYNKAKKRLRGATTHMGQNIGWGKDGLIYWANNQGLEGRTLEEARDTATISGTVAHHLIECDLKKIEPELKGYSKEDIDKAEIAYLEYLEWRKNFNFEPLAIEPHLVSEKWQYGLTPDVIGYVNKSLAVIDWKSGRIYANTFGQLIAYRVGWEENNPDKPITGGYHILRIPKDEDVPRFHHSHWMTLPDEAWITFECALKLSKCEKVLKSLL